MDVRKEEVQVALDIDGGKITGEYYYDWYPITGNALYAMPEKGARVEVYFGSRDEQEGFGSECFLFAINVKEYQNKYMKMNIENLINLGWNINFLQNNKMNKLSLTTIHLLIDSSINITTFVKNNIMFKGKRIILNCRDELNINYMKQ